MEVSQSKTAIAHTVQSRGWGMILARMLERIRQMDALASDSGRPTEVRVDAMARRAELLGLVDHVYALAGVENPFTVQKLAVLSAQRILVVPEASPAPEPASPLTPVPRRPRRSGGVA